MIKQILMLFVILILRTTQGQQDRNDENYVVTLNDSDFEHKTQISTGMTTGDWFILMAPKGDCKKCAGIEKILKQLSAEFRGRINIAVLDRDESRLTQRRFKIKTPVLKFFRSGFQWEYKGMVAQSNIANFITGGYQSQTGYRPPKPIDAIDAWQEDFVKEMKAAYKEKRLPEKDTLIVTLIGLGIGLLVLACICAPKSTGEDNEKTASKRQSKKKNK